MPQGLARGSCAAVSLGAQVPGEELLPSSECLRAELLFCCTFQQAEKVGILEQIRYFLVIPRFIDRLDGDGGRLVVSAATGRALRWG